MKDLTEQQVREYFRKRYPLASKKEIDKQINDWLNKEKASEALVKFFIDRVGEVKGRKLLDVGFGSGGVSVAFAKAGAIVSGVDIEEDLKEIAEKYGQEFNIDFKIYNGSELPFENDYFDYIASSSVLEHVSHPEKVLKEMFRVLKPKGRILLSLPNKYYPVETHTLAWFVSYMPRWMAKKYLKILKRSPLEHDNLHFYSYFQIIDMLKKTGYKYRVLYKENSTGLKGVVVKILKKLGIHYTILLKQLTFILKKA